MTKKEKKNLKIQIDYNKMTLIKGQLSILKWLKKNKENKATKKTKIDHNKMAKKREQNN